MNPASSYLRHVIVTAVLFLLAKYKFPLEGADAFADAVALAVIGTGTWAIVKYLPALAKHLGLLALLFMLPCCDPGMPLNVSAAYIDPQTGAKAVLGSQEGRLAGRVRVPITDASGRQTGWVDFSGK